MDLIFKEEPVHSDLLFAIQVKLFEFVILMVELLLLSLLLLLVLVLHGFLTLQDKNTTRNCIVHILSFYDRENDIKEINKSIAEIPQKTNQLYDRMDLVIMGGSCLVIG